MGTSIYFVTITIKKIENPKDSWQMTNKEKKEAGILKKEKGNNMFKLKEFQRSVNQYKKGIELLESINDSADSTNSNENNNHIELEEKEKKEIKTILNTLRSNISMAYIKTKEFQNAVEISTKVLNESPDHLKARIRRAKANIE